MSNSEASDFLKKECENLFVHLDEYKGEEQEHVMNLIMAYRLAVHALDYFQREFLDQFANNFKDN